MLGHNEPDANMPDGSAMGIAGILRLAEDLPSWAKLPNAAELASYNASAIEKFGNGGGNFRRLYADFLSWAHQGGSGQVPGEAADLCRAAADGWTALAGLLWKAGVGEDTWRAASLLAQEIAIQEKDLFERLASAGARASV